MATALIAATENLDHEQHFSRWLLGLLHVLNTNRAEFGIPIEDLRRIDEHVRRIRQAIEARDERRRTLESREADLDEFEARCEIERERLMNRLREASQAVQRAQEQAEVSVAGATRAITPLTESLLDNPAVPDFILHSLGLDGGDAPLEAATPAPSPAARPSTSSAPPKLSVKRSGTKQFVLTWEDAGRTQETGYEVVVQYRSIANVMNYRGRVREIAAEQETSEIVSLYGARFDYNAERASLGSNIRLRLVATDPNGRQRPAADVEVVCE